MLPLNNNNHDILYTPYFTFYLRIPIPTYLIPGVTAGAC